MQRAHGVHMEPMPTYAEADQLFRQHEENIAEGISQGIHKWVKKKREMMNASI